MVKLHTNHGIITLELDAEKAPKTVENFLQYVRDGFFDGTIFHRVIDGFMIQGGDPEGTGFGGPGYGIIDEFPSDANGQLLLRHEAAGILSMANSGANTGGSQFFITLDETSWLDGKHSVFGRVVEGLEVVQAVGATATDANDRPLTEVVMESVTITVD